MSDREAYQPPKPSFPGAPTSSTCHPATAQIAAILEAGPGAAEFFRLIEELVRASEVVVDRPMGSAHPRIPEAIYPLDYGYLDGTASGDGDGIDVFIGSAANTGVVAILVIADPVKRDIEIKLLLDCSADEVIAAHRFVQNVLGIGGLLIPRG